MGRPPSSAEENMKKGPWTPEEDEKLSEYINKHGHGSWRALPRLVGLNRCGKSCRLRWMNYLRPDIKRGNFSEEEERIIIHHHSIMGNKWSQIATQLPGRTDNEIKNFWNTHIRKKLLQKGIDPKTHKPLPSDHVPNDLLMSLIIAQSLNGPSNNILGSSASNPWDIIATELAKIQMVQNLVRLIGTSPPNIMDHSHYNTLLGSHVNTANHSSEPQKNIIPGVNTIIVDIDQAINSLPWASSDSAMVGTGNPGLPAIWSSPSSNGSNESTPACSSFTAKSNASMNMFEDLEKLMEDDTCASFLEDLLQQ